MGISSSETRDKGQHLLPIGTLCSLAISEKAWAGLSGKKKSMYNKSYVMEITNSQLSDKTPMFLLFLLEENVNTWQKGRYNTLQ